MYMYVYVCMYMYSMIAPEFWHEIPLSQGLRRTSACSLDGGRCHDVLLLHGGLPWDVWGLTLNPKPFSVCVVGRVGQIC